MSLESDPCIALTEALIARRSITPDDAGCQQYLKQQLSASGFHCVDLPFGKVSNVWARYGTQAPLLVWVGHTDVVPSGPEEQWSSPPFQPTRVGDRLVGRGAADMKGSIASMVTAAQRFVAKHPQFNGSLVFLITSDEEGPSIDGTARVVEWMKSQNITPQWCLVGEPSSEERLGDILKIGRRGSLNGALTVHGIQGHIAYPDKARNPIAHSIPALEALQRQVWDEGDEFFPPTQLQFSNIHAGTGANNVIPGTLEVTFNIRYHPQHQEADLKSTVEALLTQHGLTFELNWATGAHPFYSAPGRLAQACQSSIQTALGYSPRLSTHGGTSDGRFLAPLGCEIVEMGPCNGSIHQIDEWVSMSELIQLSEVYEQVLHRLFI